VRVVIEGDGLRIGFIGTAVGVRCIVPCLTELASAAAVETREVDDYWDDPLRWLGDVDLAVVEGHKDAVGVLPREASVVLPVHVQLVTALPEPGGRVEDLIPKNERARVRRQIRQFGYTYRVSQDDAEFAAFFREMYVPTMRTRHADRARSVAEPEARERIFAHGNLLTVLADGVPVGGTVNLLDPGRERVVARLVGVAAGDDRHLRQGVMKASGHFLLEWAAGNGFRAVDFQGAEPFPHRGTFRSKVLLGAGVEPAPGLADLRFWLSARRDTEAVRRFLVRNPVLSCDLDGRFGTVYFDAGDGPRDRVHIRRGLAGERTVHLGDFLTDES
jgi:hypothetical protein